MWPTHGDFRLVVQGVEEGEKEEEEAAGVGHQRQVRGVLHLVLRTSRRRQTRAQQRHQSV